MPVRSKTALEIRELKKIIGIRKLFALLANLIAFISPCENSARKKAKKREIAKVSVLHANTLMYNSVLTIPFTLSNGKIISRSVCGMLAQIMK